MKNKNCLFILIKKLLKCCWIFRIRKIPRFSTTGHERKFPWNSIPYLPFSLVQSREIEWINKLLNAHVMWHWKTMTWLVSAKKKNDILASMSGHLTTDKHVGRLTWCVSSPVMAAPSGPTSLYWVQFETLKMAVAGQMRKKMFATITNNRLHGTHSIQSRGGKRMR